MLKNKNEKKFIIFVGIFIFLAAVLCGCGAASEDVGTKNTVVVTEEGDAQEQPSYQNTDSEQTEARITAAVNILHAWKKGCSRMVTIFVI